MVMQLYEAIIDLLVQLMWKMSWAQCKEALAHLKLSLTKLNLKTIDLNTSAR